MFERYTEKARRAIFFARYEASQFGLEYIDSNCLLIGLVRENGQISTQWLALNATELHHLVESQTIRSKPRPTSVDLPLTNEAKRVLAHAGEEADRLAHRHIGTEHLFLGLLREPETFAAKRVKERGMTLEQIRGSIAEDSSGHEPNEGSQRRPLPSALQIRLMDETGAQVAFLPWIGRPPAIGEGIAITDEKSGEAQYRVLDIIWSIRTGEAGSHLAEVVLKVRKEQQ